MNLHRNNILPAAAGPLHLALGIRRVRTRLDKWMADHPGERLPISEDELQAIAVIASRPELASSLPHSGPSDAIVRVHPNHFAHSRLARLVASSKARAPQLVHAIEGELVKVITSAAPSSQLALWWSRKGLSLHFEQWDRIKARRIQFSALSDADREGKPAQEKSIIEGRFMVREVVEKLLQQQKLNAEHMDKIWARLKMDLQAAEAARLRFWPPEPD